MRERQPIFMTGSYLRATVSCGTGWVESNRRSDRRGMASASRNSHLTDLPTMLQYQTPQHLSERLATDSTEPGGSHITHACPHSQLPCIDEKNLRTALTSACLRLSQNAQHVGPQPPSTCLLHGHGFEVARGRCAHSNLDRKRVLASCSDKRALPPPDPV